MKELEYAKVVAANRGIFGEEMANMARALIAVTAQLEETTKQLFEKGEELAALKLEINWPVAQKVRAALDRAACPDAFMRIAVEACTDALKGDQVPVADADYTRYSCGCCGFESLHHTTKCPECNYHKIESEPLFTAPQKPCDCEYTVNDNRSACLYCGALMGAPDDTVKTKEPPCDTCGGKGSYHCPKVLGTVECECECGGG